MADIDIPMTTGVVGALAGLAGAVRWLGGLWREMRREQIQADLTMSERQSKANDRMIDALNDNAREMATLSTSLQHFDRRLSELFDRTPVHGVPVPARDPVRDIPPARDDDRPRGPGLDTARRRQEEHRRRERERDARGGSSTYRPPKPGNNDD